MDIDGIKIYLDSVKVYFEDNKRTYKGMKITGDLFFKCSNTYYSNCISNGDDLHSSIGFAFKSKDGAYKIINLVYDLRKELNKN